MRIERPVDERIAVELELGAGAKGLLVVDTTVDDTSSGGLRVTEDLTLGEVSALAREMTPRFSFVGRPSGGAKSGLRIPSGASVEEKRRFGDGPVGRLDGERGGRDAVFGAEVDVFVSGERAVADGGRVGAQGGRAWI